MRKTLVLGAVLLAASSAYAISTRSFRVTSYGDFDEGEAKGVLISSLGELRTGFSTKRLELPAAFVRCMVESPTGVVYIGTGTQGELWAYEHGHVRKVARLPEAVEITALAAAADGTVFAGVTPGGKIYAIRGASTRV